MEKFTKGPWNKNGRLIYSGYKFIATASQTDVTGWPELEANSSLIAAAPEMYKFLKDIASGNGVDYPIEQLLAKARGEK